MNLVSRLLIGSLVLASAVAFIGRAVGRDNPPAAQPASRPAVTYETVRDIEYRTDANPDPYMREKCRADLYHPTNAPGFATVVWFHGGGLTGGGRDVPESLRGQGFAVVGAGYRLSPNVKSPVYIEDAAAAVAWTIKNIEKYGGDPKRIYVGGHSAGGYLALMVGMDKRWLAAHQIDCDTLKALIPLSPQAITHFTIRGERGLPREQPVIDDLAPLFHVRKDCPPIAIITGDRETELLGRYEENAYFWRMLKIVGHPNVQLVEIQGFDHGQMVKPGLLLLARYMENENLRASR